MSSDPDTHGQDAELTELVDLSMPADSESIAATVDAISEALGRLQIPEQKGLEIALAVQEALANAVVHGCGGDPSKFVRCRMRADAQGRVVITVSDPGPGFRSELVSDPQRPEGLYQDHGRGVYLIRQLMDEVHFEQNGTQIRMWKY